MSVIDTTEYCRFCLMCRHMCPVGHITHLETLTPHGWAQIIASEKRKMIEWNESTVDILYSCADCGVCQSHCVTDQPLPDAIAAVRAELVSQGIAPGKVTEYESQFEQWENLYEEKSPRKSEGKGEYALFVGDAAAYLWPDTIPAVLKLLEAVGIKPALIGYGRNSGYLANSLGLVSSASKIARKNLAECEEAGARYLLVPDPEARYAFERLYSERLSITLPDRLEVLDVLTFLDQKHQAGDLSFNRIEVGIPYAYVDPTHAVRTPDRFEAPRRLANAVLPTPVLELFWRKERAHPAGDSALQFMNASLAKQLTQARHEDAAQTGAQGIVTESPATLYHLQQLSSSGLPVKGLYELLAAQIG